ncbi:MAG: iron-containing redox enzyme family protein [Actinomycetota bacterium]|nr:iron-containing redox enzyme family protein [Actinomycetota bacterium]
MESDRLRRKLAFAFPVLSAAGRRFLDHPRAAELYPEYLFTMHCIVRASVPLMEAAVQQAAAVSDRDLVADRVAEYLEQHIPEERDHDEWLLEDLETLGVDRSAVLARPPSASVAAVVGAQYYWVIHYHPVALLGYIALLEGYPPRRDEIEALMARTGLDPGAFRTLLAHAELDPHHRDDLNRTLDGLPLQPEHRSALGVSAMHSVYLLARCIDEVIERDAAQPVVPATPVR